MIEEGSHRHLCKIVDRRTSNGFQLENLEEAVDHAGRGAIAGADSEDSVDPGITRRCLEDRIGTEIIRRRIDILALINPLDNVRGAASYGNTLPESLSPSKMPPGTTPTLRKAPSGPPMT
jgi:hypothetical protein